MDNLRYLIGYVEERHNAVCDSFQEHDDVLVLELRTVRETFEYSCLVTINRETRFIEEYEFLWSWYRNPPKKFQIEPEPPVLAMTNVDVVPFAIKPEIPSPVRRTVRRKIAEMA